MGVLQDYFNSTTDTLQIHKDMTMAMSTRHRYREEIEDPENPMEMIPNPQTRKEFVFQLLAKQFGDELIAYTKDIEDDKINASIEAAKVKAATID
ncbi:MAG: hypothetical protein ACXABY_19430 [Candidatus Thorarchaeota archaeon]|jgi:hypothetical protein